MNATPRDESINWRRGLTVMTFIWTTVVSVATWVINRGFDQLAAMNDERVLIEHRITEGAKDNERDKARLEKLERDVKELQQLMGSRK